MATDDELRKNLRHFTDHHHIRLLDGDFLTIDEQWNAQNVRSGHWRLYVNNRSGAEIRWNGGCYPLRPYRIHLIPAWIHFSCHNIRPLDHLYLHFDLIGIPGEVVRSVFNCPRMLVEHPELELLAGEVAKRLRNTGTDDLRTTMNAKGLIFLVLADWLDRLSDDDYRTCHMFAAAPQPIRTLLAWIEKNLDRPIGTTDLAERCHLSDDHFVRLFKKYVGQSPAKFVLERRIAAAAERLLFTSQSIEQIARSTGFANRFHFSRCFARQMNATPASYRKSSRV
jgi:AraC-like DNA-binding protein